MPKAMTELLMNEAILNSPDFAPKAFQPKTGGESRVACPDSNTTKVHNVFKHPKMMLPLDQQIRQSTALCFRLLHLLL